MVRTALSAAGGLAACLLVVFAVRYWRSRPRVVLVPEDDAGASNRIVPQGPQGQRQVRATPAASDVRQTIPVLFVVGGPYHGQQFPLRDSFWVGTHKKANFRVKGDPDMETRHAQFTIDRSGVWFVRDNRTSGGTFVNGVRITRKQLTSGMLIRMGRTEVRFLDKVA